MNLYQRSLLALFLCGNAKAQLRGSVAPSSGDETRSTTHRGLMAGMMGGGGGGGGGIPPAVATEVAIVGGVTTSSAVIGFRTDKSGVVSIKYASNPNLTTK